MHQSHVSSKTCGGFLICYLFSMVIFSPHGLGFCNASTSLLLMMLGLRSIHVHIPGRRRDLGCKSRELLGHQYLAPQARPRSHRKRRINSQRYVQEVYFTHASKWQAKHIRVGQSKGEIQHIILLIRGFFQFIERSLIQNQVASRARKRSLTGTLDIQIICAGDIQKTLALVRLDRDRLAFARDKVDLASCSRRWARKCTMLQHYLVRGKGFDSFFF